MNDKEIQKAAEEFFKDSEYPVPNIYCFIKGAKWALSHQWISVDERLPEDDSIVTAHSPNGRIDVLKYHDGEFIDELGQAHYVDYFIPILSLNPKK